MNTLENKIQAENDVYQRQLKAFFITALATGLIIHIASPILGNTLLAGWRWEHIPIHSSIEIIGTVIALIVAKILIAQERLGKGTSFNTWIAGALIGMGLLDGMHALLYLSNNWSWFHGVASLWGGLLFSFVWLGEDAQRKVSPYWQHIVVTITLFLCAMPYLFPSLIVQMIVDGEFTFMAKFINVTGGLLLILASVKLLIRYFQTKNIDDVLFFVHCLLFGLAAIMFQQSRLWDFPWWSWHLLRLMAYGAALWFVIVVQKRVESELLTAAISTKTREILERLQLVVSASGIGVWSYHLQSKTLNWDNQMLILNGLEQNNFHNSFKEWSEIIYPDDRLLFQKNFNQAIAELHGYDMKYRIILPNGAIRHIHTKGKIIKDENEISSILLGVNWDVTQESEYETKLILARKKAETSLNTKSSFLANMSHEIRTPLNGILGFLHLLSDEKMSEDAVESVEYIRKCSDTLLVVINDILDFSKIESGNINLEKIPFNLNETVEASVFTFNTIASSKGISINYNVDEKIPSLIVGDPFRLKQILLNLISNAIKFTPKGTIRISADSNREDDYNSMEMEITFMVKDSGIGISKETQETIFEVFKQSDDSTTREYGGTGLGLAICSNLVGIMGGEMWVESELGEGASFIFTLPTQENNANSLPHDSGSGFEIEKKQYHDVTMLLVEDYPLNQILVKKLLKKLGYTKIDTANNGKEAVKAASDKQYDFIFMDIQMPEMDGYQATKDIRSGLNENTKIIGLSASVFSENIEKAIASGMDDFLEKPIDIAKLAAVLKNKERVSEKMEIEMETEAEV